MSEETTNFAETADDTNAGATATLEASDTTAPETVPGSEVASTDDASATRESEAESLAFNLLSQGKTPDQVAAEVDRFRKGDETTPTPETTDETSADEGATPTPANDSPAALDPASEQIAKRWKLDTGKIAALPEDVRSTLLAELKARSDFVDAQLRENAELRKKAGLPEAKPQQDAPEATDAGALADEPALVKKLADHFGEDAGKAILEVAKQLAQPAAASARTQAVAAHFSQQVAKGFEGVKSILPPGVDDTAKDRIVGKAIEILQSGKFRPGFYDLADAIPEAVAALYPVNSRQSAVASIANSARRASAGTPGRATTPSRPTAPKAVDHDALESEAFEALSRGETPEQFRQRKGLA